MDYLDKSEWAKRKHEWKERELEECAEELSNDDITEQVVILKEKLRGSGDTTLDNKLQSLKKDAANLAHRAYIILESLEDAGIDVATRHADRLAEQWPELYSRLDTLREQVHAIIEKQSNDEKECND